LLKIERLSVVRLYAFLTAILLIGTLSGCATGKYQQTEIQLNHNQKKWTAQNIVNYRYIIRISTSYVRASVTVEVRDAEAKSITYPDSSQLAGYEIFKTADTVDKLFHIIKGAISQEADNITVAYDPMLGYPRDIFIDTQVKMVHETVLYSILDFEVVK
jgi:hypothetical protein